MNLCTSYFSQSWIIKDFFNKILFKISKNLHRFFSCYNSSLNVINATSISDQEKHLSKKIPKLDKLSHQCMMSLSRIFVEAQLFSPSWFNSGFYSYKSFVSKVESIQKDLLVSVDWWNRKIAQKQHKVSQNRFQMWKKCKEFCINSGRDYFGGTFHLVVDQ